MFTVQCGLAGKSGGWSSSAAFSPSCALCCGTAPINSYCNISYSRGWLSIQRALPTHKSGALVSHSYELLTRQLLSPLLSQDSLTSVVHHGEGSYRQTSDLATRCRALSTAHVLSLTFLTSLLLFLTHEAISHGTVSWGTVIEACHLTRSPSLTPLTGMACSSPLQAAHTSLCHITGSSGLCCQLEFSVPARVVPRAERPEQRVQ